MICKMQIQLLAKAAKKNRQNQQKCENLNQSSEKVKLVKDDEAWRGVVLCTRLQADLFERRSRLTVYRAGSCEQKGWS